MKSIRSLVVLACVSGMLGSLHAHSYVVSFEDPFEAIDRVWQDTLQRVGGKAPKTQVWEKENNVVVRMEVPGFSSENIKVHAYETSLQVSGKVEEKKEEKNKDSIATYAMKSFERTVSLPTKVQPGKAEAKIENGVLMVTIPKEEKVEPKGRLVPIK